MNDYAGYVDMNHTKVQWTTIDLSNRIAVYILLNV